MGAFGKKSCYLRRELSAGLCSRHRGNLHRRSGGLPRRWFPFPFPSCSVDYSWGMPRSKLQLAKVTGVEACLPTGLPHRSLQAGTMICLYPERESRQGSPSQPGLTVVRTDIHMSQIGMSLSRHTLSLMFINLHKCSYSTVAKYCHLGWIRGALGTDI